LTKDSPFNISQINPSAGGYTETTEGFSAANPNVGTITHGFTFTSDPWRIAATSGVDLCVLSTINLSLSKVFNPDNTTDCFYVLSWNPTNYYRADDIYSAPAVTIGLLDGNGAILDAAAIGWLNAHCGITSTQSLQRIVNAIYFDRVQRCVFSVSAATWYPCT
jgi:hypothetical protein